MDDRIGTEFSGFRVNAEISRRRLPRRASLPSPKGGLSHRTLFGFRTQSCISARIGSGADQLADGPVHGTALKAEDEPDSPGHGRPFEAFRRWCFRFSTSILALKSAQRPSAILISASGIAPVSFRNVCSRMIRLLERPIQHPVQFARSGTGALSIPHVPASCAGREGAGWRASACTGVDLVVQCHLAPGVQTIDEDVDRLGSIRSAVVDGLKIWHRGIVPAPMDRSGLTHARIAPARGPFLLVLMTTPTKPIPVSSP